MRTIIKTYVYECDAQIYDYSCDSLVEISTGFAIPSHVGALWPNLDGKVRTADDADLVMLRSHKWFVKDGVHLCPNHHPDNEDDE